MYQIYLHRHGMVKILSGTLTLESSTISLVNVLAIYVM